MPGVTIWWMADSGRYGLDALELVPVVAAARVADQAHRGLALLTRRFRGLRRLEVDLGTALSAGRCRAVAAAARNPIKQHRDVAVQAQQAEVGLSRCSPGADLQRDATGLPGLPEMAPAPRPVGSPT